MTDRTCPTCSHIFKFPSDLKKHFKNSFHCTKNNDDIEIYFNINTNVNNIASNTNNEYKCNKCNTYFSQKCTLTRHYNHSKCGKSQALPDIILPRNITGKQLRKIIKEEADKLYKGQLQPQQQATAPQLINNDNNHHNTNNTTNNNLTINNTIVQHIYPLGFERLPNIPQARMKRLLTLGDDGVIDIVKLVCEQDENKNFYKLNMNKSNISYLSKEYKVDICQESELKEKLLKQCVVLTYQMLVACSPILTNIEIDYINSNLQNVSKKMKEEIYDNGLRNIIEYELRNNNKITRDRLIKYTEVVKTNPEAKQKAIKNCNEVLKIKENNKKNLTPYFTMKKINRRLGDPLELEEMTDDFNYDNFMLNRFDTSYYYIYWTKRIEDEENLINSSPNKTIADIINLDTRKKSINTNLEYMNQLNGTIGTLDKNNKEIITKDNFSVKIAEEYVMENNRKKYLGDRYNTNSEAEDDDIAKQDLEKQDLEKQDLENPARKHIIER